MAEDLLVDVPVDLIDPSSLSNDRTEFDPVELQLLAESIAANGLQQRPVVRSGPP